MQPRGAYSVMQCSRKRERIALTTLVTASGRKSKADTDALVTVNRRMWCEALDTF